MFGRKKAEKEAQSGAARPSAPASTVAHNVEVPHTAPTSFGNRYKVVKCIGRGGMAEVFQAIDTTLDRVVAIKAMLPELAGDQRFNDRFKNEAKAAARMVSPYVVNIYDWGEDGQKCFIVMEYVRGIDLKKAVSRRGPLHPRKVAEIAVQACAALHEAHERGIIHRDIKSSNIMMQTTGNIKIMDFGIAQAGPVATTGDKVAGTASYMSPEQKQGKPATEQSDLYSLGASLYELCTGILPYTPATARMDGLGPGELIAPHFLNANVDLNLSALLVRALQPNPKQRYGSAEEMGVAFESYLKLPNPQPSMLPYPDFWVLGCTRGPSNLVGTMLPFSEDVVAGRSKSAGLVIGDPTVSSKHVKLKPCGMYLQVEDLYSINGTLLNGTPLRGKALCLPGTNIDLGKVRLKVGSKKQ